MISHRVDTCFAPHVQDVSITARDGSTWEPVIVSSGRRASSSAPYPATDARALALESRPAQNFSKLHGFYY